MTVLSFLRKLRGERPGMSAGAEIPTHTTYLYYPITIQTQVRLADVSYYNGEINFNVMRAVLNGTIIRAGQRNWVDSKFRTNWTKAKSAGIPRGSYWLYDSREDPKKQAVLWWSLLQGDPGELVHVADFEESYGGPYGMPSHMRTFLQEFQRLSNLPDDRLAIYTGYFWWTQRVGNNAFFRRFALWLAWYAPMGAVHVPAPWIETDLIFWQYTSSGPGPLYGVSSLEIDLNWYCCDAKTFSLRFGLGAPAPDGGTMTKYYKWTSVGANIRADHTSGSADKGDLVTGDVIQVDDSKVGAWFPYKHAQHSDGTWVNLTDGTPLDMNNTVTYWSPDSYFVEVTGFPGPVTPPPDPDPDPTPTLPDMPVTIVLGDDLTYIKQTITATLKPKV